MQKAAQKISSGRRVREQNVKMDALNEAARIAETYTCLTTCNCERCAVSRAIAREIRNVK